MACTVVDAKNLTPNPFPRGKGDRKDSGRGGSGVLSPFAPFPERKGGYETKASSTVTSFNRAAIGP